MKELKKEDYKLMVCDIKRYIEKSFETVISGEGERILLDIEEIIKSWEEE